MQITIPLCSASTSMTQVFDTNTCLRTNFQINTLKEISERPEFMQFVTMEHNGIQIIVAPEFKCKFMVTWYDNNTRMHFASVGQRRILHSGIIAMQ